jgi:hypothetical protein
VDCNPANNVLVVGGCYWAAPYRTLLLDFSEPMKETKWVDVHEQFGEGYNLGYDTYGDIDFVRWYGDILILNGYKGDKSVKVEMLIQNKQKNLAEFGVMV